MNKEQRGNESRSGEVCAKGRKGNNPEIREISALKNCLLRSNGFLYLIEPRFGFVGGGGW